MHFLDNMSGQGLGGFKPQRVITTLHKKSAPIPFKPLLKHVQIIQIQSPQLHSPRRQPTQLTDDK